MNRAKTNDDAAISTCLVLLRFDLLNIFFTRSRSKIKSITAEIVINNAYSCNVVSRETKRAIDFNISIFMAYFGLQGGVFRYCFSISRFSWLNFSISRYCPSVNG